MTWQIMMRALAQAGNRTSKTALCRQWWDSRLEWRADASGTGNQHHRQLFVSCTRPLSKKTQKKSLQCNPLWCNSSGPPGTQSKFNLGENPAVQLAFGLCAWPCCPRGAKATVLSKKTQKKVCNATLCGAILPGRPAPLAPKGWSRSSKFVQQ